MPLTPKSSIAVYQLLLLPCNTLLTIRISKCTMIHRRWNRYPSCHYMGLLPDTQNCGLRMHRECRERFPRHRGLTIPACTTTRAVTHVPLGHAGIANPRFPRWRENVPRIPSACSTHNFTYLVRGPYKYRFNLEGDWGMVTPMAHASQR